MVDAITFVTFYHRILVDLKANLSQVYHPRIEQMMEEDPHDLIAPDQSFKDYTEMYNYILQSIIRSTEN